MGFRYIGAKTNLIHGILRSIREIVDKGAHIADLMCGTAAVSASLRKNGYVVTANDIMTYAFHHARVALLFNSTPDFKAATDFISSYYPDHTNELFPPSNYEKILHALNKFSPTKGYFWREFSTAGSPENKVRPRNYFSPQNAQKIDSIRCMIKKLRHERAIDDLEHSLLIHDLIMAVNNCANIAGTYGHYMSRQANRLRGRLNLIPSNLILIPDRGNHTVYKECAEKISREISCDLCYIDPPYMKRQYAANYHILETIAREDEPEAIGVSGLRPWRDQYSDFCSKNRIRDSFREIFSNMRCNHFLISYSEDGLLSIGDLRKLFEEFGQVKKREFKNKRFKSNNTKREPYLIEYIFYLNIR